MEKTWHPPVLAKQNTPEPQNDAIPKLQKAALLDHYGNVHYQLYIAYRKLGQAELAQKALAWSQELRRGSLERDQALIMGGPEVDSEPQ